jgi:hypothetical protein
MGWSHIRVIGNAEVFHRKAASGKTTPDDIRNCSAGCGENKAINWPKPVTNRKSRCIKDMPGVVGAGAYQN